MYLISIDGKPLMIFADHKTAELYASLLRESGHIKAVAEYVMTELNTMFDVVDVLNALARVLDPLPPVAAL